MEEEIKRLREISHINKKIIGSFGEIAGALK
jgi:hypothetical protein